MHTAARLLALLDPAYANLGLSALIAAALSAIWVAARRGLDPTLQPAPVRR